jgi:anti-sigma B factor antagonist
MEPRLDDDWITISSHSLGNSEVSIVQLHGRIDVFRASQLRQQIITTAADRPQLILFDMQDVSFLDSAGLGSLIFGVKHVRALGGEVSFCALHDQPKALFDLINMHKVLKIYDSCESFKQERNHDRNSLETSD